MKTNKGISDQQKVDGSAHLKKREKHVGLVFSRKTCIWCIHLSENKHINSLIRKFIAVVIKIVRNDF